MRAGGHAGAHELRQPRPRRLRHGGWLLHGHPGQPLGHAISRRATAGLPVHGGVGLRLRAHALCSRVSQEPPRPGAVHHRPRLHVDRRGRLCDGLEPDVRALARLARRTIQRAGRRHRPLSAADHRRLRPPHADAAAHSGAYALRQPAARRRRRPTRGPRPRHQRGRRVRADLRLRVGARRSWGSAGRGNPRPRSDLSSQVHDLLPDCGHGWRHVQHHRAVPGLASSRHRRRGRQVLHADARRLRHLLHHDPGADLATAGPLRPRRCAMSPHRLADEVGRRLATRARWHPMEVLFWGAVLASIYILPGRHLILTEIAILGLFALSLDLILGYAGIVSLGQAAFFGFGAYTAGLLAKHDLVTEPLLALIVSGVAAALVGFVTSFLVLRGSDLTRIMVTLGVALVLREIANRYAWLTGGADGLQGIEIKPLLGVFRFDMFGHTAFCYALGVLIVLFLLARRIVHSPFGLSLQSIKGNPVRAAAVGIPVNGRLVAIYTIAAGYAGVAGALLTQTTAFTSLSVLDFERSADLLLVLIIGGTGYLYGGLIGALIFKLMQDYLSALTPQYWPFWIGLVLVVIVLVGRDRFSHWTRPLHRLADRLDWRAGQARRATVSERH